MADEAERNVISGNAGSGVVITGAGSDGNVVAGNYIGTDLAGTEALPNAQDGVAITAGARSNRIGTDGDGLADEAERNVISGNFSHGVLITGTGTDLNVVAGNYLGTDATGTVALGNGFGVEYGAGVAVFSGAQSNRIGTDGNGVADTAERNVISGNSSKGVSIAHEETSDNVVAGNYIGTDVTGTVALGNGQDGVKIWWASNQRIGGTSPGEGNLISGNARYGIFIQGDEAGGNLVQGNCIGTDVSGTEALGNGAHGVLIADGAHSNAIGGDAASGNLIAWNAGAGVAVVGEDTTGNRIQANSIHDNGGLGIDLGDDGPTPNVPTLGVGTPSRWQDYPVITAAGFGTVTRVIGTFSSTPNAEFTLDFYANGAADPSGYGEGERWLGSTRVTTDASGNARFDAALPSATTFGELITATATDADGNTSEFSAAADSDTAEPWDEYRDVVMADQPFAYYRLGESAGATTAVDETGVHHGTYVNDPALEVPGAVLTDPDDTAAEFDAAQYVEGTTMADYGSRMIDGFTIECWVRLSVPTGWSNILGTANPGYTTNVQLSVDQTRSMRLYFRDDDWDRYSVWFYSEGDNAEIFDQEWHHLVFAYDPTPANPSDRFDLYIDSVPQELEVQPGNDRPDGTSDFVYPMILGGWHQRGTVIPTYEGDLDEVAFYARPLSSAEVGEHYGAGACLHAPVAVNDDDYRVEESAVLCVSAAHGVLSNDWDLDGDELAADLLDRPDHGTLTLEPDGSFRYAPEAGFVGIDTFTYRAFDGHLDSDLATVMIIVESGTPRPVPFYFSLKEGGTVDALEVAAEDVVFFDGTDFELYFDGSDVGLRNMAIDALAVIGENEILMSFVEPGSVLGIPGTVDNSDVVKFTFHPFCPNAPGSFDYYFDGSDVGLEPGGENVDGVELLEDGRLVISGSSQLRVPGVSASEEDLLVFTPTSLGPSTAGTWALWFDGSDVGLAGEDVDAVAIDDRGNLLLSCTSSFYVPHVAGRDEDVFVFQPTSLGPHTAGSYAAALWFDGSDYGLTGNDVTAVDLAPNRPPVAVDDACEAVWNQVLNVPAAHGVLANDWDPDGDPLTAVPVDGPSHGTLVLGFDGSFTYVPDEGFIGIDQVTYVARDGRRDSNLATVTIEVVTLPPVAVDDGYSVRAGGTLTVGHAGAEPVELFFDDFEQGASANWSKTTTSVTPIGSRTFLGELGAESVVLALDGLPTHGELIVEFDLYVIQTWDGNDAAYGPDIWSFGLEGEEPALTTTFTNVDRFRQAYPDSYPGGDNPPQAGAVEVNTLGYSNFGDSVYHVRCVLESAQGSVGLVFAGSGLQDVGDESWGLDNVRVSIVPAGVLVNDYDPDGDPLTAVMAVFPHHGSLMLEPDGSFVYEPAPGFAGVDRFTYVANDGLRDSSPATVTIEVRNQPPIAVDDAYETRQGEPLVVTQHGLIADPLMIVKDISTGIDDATDAKLTDLGPDDDYVIGAGGTGGHVGETPQVSLTVTPARYVEDGDSHASAWLTLPGTGLEDVSVLPGTYFFETQVDLTGFDPETAQIADLRYAADNKLVSIYVNGTEVFSQSTSFAEEFASFHEVGDVGMGAFQDGLNTIRFGVLNGNGGYNPMALRVEGAVEATVLETSPAGVLHNDHDPDGDPLTAILLDGPAHGSLDFHDDGTFEYVPQEGFVGVDTFTYAANDGLADSNVATATICVGEILGPVGFLEVTDLDPSAADLWYQCSTTHEALLTLEASFNGPIDSVQLTLCDEDLVELATCIPVGGNRRIDWEVDPGQTYYFKLSGTNSDVDLRLVNLVHEEDSTVIVYGTDGEDRFEFEAYVQPPGGPLGAVDHRVTINGVAYTFTLPTIPPPVLFVTFDGGGGDDTAVFHGSAGNDRVKLWPDRGRVDGFGYTVITKNVEAATAHGGGGADVASLYDSPGPDAFTAGPDSAELTGPGFALAVHGFPEVHAFASDDAETDTAILEDRAGSKDQFRAWSTEAKMCGLGFYNRAKGFDDVQAGASDATDVAELHDSLGPDTFQAHADSATMSYAGGRTVRADDFGSVFAFASDDGQTDTAYLYDTTANPATSYASWFKGFHGTAKMYAVSTFYNRVDGFDEVIASAVGGDDTAKLFDSSGADALDAYADQATMSYPDGTTVRADDFRWVLGYASDDGQVDTARLHDTTADGGTSYATWFKADDKIARLYADPVFYVQARDFDRASASAVGDDDTAKLFDSALDDVYWSRPDHSRMEYADGTYAEALDFRNVRSYSRYGSDTATLYDETSGGTSHAARFVGNAAWAKLYDGAFYSRTEGFAEVRAVFWGGDDLAWVYDDPTRTDHLVVSHPNPFIAAAQAKLWNDRRAIYVDYFHTLTATTSQDFVDDADIDPAYEDDVILTGNWADV